MLHDDRPEDGWEAERVGSSLGLPEIPDGSWQPEDLP